MPRQKRTAPKPRAPRELTSAEKRFATWYIKLGCDDLKLGEIERMGRFARGSGAALLANPLVKGEIDRRMAPVRMEQERQAMLADAVALATAQLAERTRRAEEEAAAAKAEAAAVKADKESLLLPVTSPARYRVNREELEHQLMHLAINLNPETHPDVKLRAIQMGFVVDGVLEGASLKRGAPPDRPEDPGAPRIYGNLFDRMRAGALAPADAPPPTIEGDGEVFDLTPVKPSGPTPNVPPAGESINEQPATDSRQRTTRAKTKAAPSVVHEVITVDLG